jgi:ornithine cyclodeaminase/alanine dehydrogenase-like protein (mu-crystallin family)
MDLSEQSGLQLTREPETMLFPPNASRTEVLSLISTAPSKTVEFLYLDQETMIAAGVLNMRQAIDVVGQAQALLAEGLVRQPHKVVLRNQETAQSEEEGRFNGLCASIGVPPHSMGMKWIGSFPANRERGLPRASALIILNSPQTGFPIALMDGTLVNAMRTGAMTALGLRYLAPKKTRKAGIIGSGVQSRTQILALYTELPQLEEIAIFGRHASSAEAVAEDCRKQWGAPVRPVPTIDQALDDADVALTITTADQPLMFARHIKPGALTIQLAGHECESAVIQQCSKIVTDDWDVIEHRGIMTPAIMHQQGLLNREDIYANLGELILGRKPGRENDEERIHYCHMGMGIDDISLAWAVYQTACERNLGLKLPLWREPLWL